MSFEKLLGLNAIDREAMCSQLGIRDADKLFDVIPDAVRLKNPLDLPAALSEWDLQRQMTARAQKNDNCLDYVSYLGAGCYDHYVPAVIDAIANRGEFLTT